MLQQHPRIVVPRVKEPRFLQPGRFGQTTVSRYKFNFDDVIARPEAVTFDASPVYLRSEVARTWLSRWLPTARMIALVRNPIQRAFSHWQMGREWMASKCPKPDQLRTLDALQPQLTFDALMERSLLLENWATCVTSAKGKGVNYQTPKSFKWALLPKPELEHAKSFHPGASLSDSSYPIINTRLSTDRGAPLFDCLRTKDAELTAKFHREMVGEWPAAAEAKPLQDGIRLLGHCSEMMLFPPGLLVKGAVYAENLEGWAKTFPREQLKVIHTDDMSHRAQQVMDETFDFLGLPRMKIGRETRMCVHGKSGVMDVLNAFEGSVRIGQNGSGELATNKLHVAPCDVNLKGMHRDPATGALHHDINPWLLSRLRDYYAPYNARLYAFLGRNFSW